MAFATDHWVVRIAFLAALLALIGFVVGRWPRWREFWGTGGAAGLDEPDDE